jgi:glyoxylase-like metal-dependent hydrolase (beta-lactamase superfamily II)
MADHWQQPEVRERSGQCYRWLFRNGLQIKNEQAMTGLWRFGEISLARVVESEEPLLSPFEIFPDCSPTNLAVNKEWLQPRFYDSESELLVICIQSFLIRSGNTTILLDSCSGNHKQRQRAFFHQREWAWLSTLRQAGVAPEDVDLVLCSHLHVDHVGWNTRLENGKWVPTFPRARYLVSRAEWEYWRSEPGIASLQRTGDFISDSVLPIFLSGQADLIDGEHGLLPGIRIEPAPGHTPGHFMMVIENGGSSAILSGDLMHHPLQLRYPDWSTRFCVDPDQARDTRRRFLAEHVDSDRLVFPAHFPTPVGGRILRQRDHYRFQFSDAHS